MPGFIFPKRPIGSIATKAARKLARSQGNLEKEERFENKKLQLAQKLVIYSFHYTQSNTSERANKFDIDHDHLKYDKKDDLESMKAVKGIIERQVGIFEKGVIFEFKIGKIEKRVLNQLQRMGSDIQDELGKLRKTYLSFRGDIRQNNKEISKGMAQIDRLISEGKLKPEDRLRILKSVGDYHNRELWVDELTKKRRGKDENPEDFRQRALKAVENKYNKTAELLTQLNRAALLEEKEKEINKLISSRLGELSQNIRRQLRIIVIIIKKRGELEKVFFGEKYSALLHEIQNREMQLLRNIEEETRTIRSIRAKLIEEGKLSEEIDQDIKFFPAIDVSNLGEE